MTSPFWFFAALGMAMLRKNTWMYDGWRFQHYKSIFDERVTDANESMSVMTEMASGMSGEIRRIATKEMDNVRRMANGQREAKYTSEKSLPKEFKDNYAKCVFAIKRSFTIMAQDTGDMGRTFGLSPKIILKE